MEFCEVLLHVLEPRGRNAHVVILTAGEIYTLILTLRFVMETCYTGIAKDT